MYAYNTNKVAGTIAKVYTCQLALELTAALLSAIMIGYNEHNAELIAAWDASWL